MSYADIKKFITDGNIKLLEYFILANTIDIKELVPRNFHDPDIKEIHKSKNECNYNFLDLCAYYGNYTTFQFFLGKVPSQTIVKSNQNFPLIFYALKGQNNEIINDVIQMGKSNAVPLKIYDGLYYSLKFGNITYLNVFFNEAQEQMPDADPEKILDDMFQSPEHRPCSPLKLAIKSKSIACVAFILNVSLSEVAYLKNTKQGKTNKRNKITPLHVAARYGCGDIASLFIALDPKMIKKKGSGKYSYPFLDAIKYNIIPPNYDEFFKHGVIKKINDPDQLDGDNALHYAVKNGDINAVKILLSQNNIDVNAKGKEEKAPIHLVSHTCSLEILRELLNHPNIDVFVKDKYNNLAIHEAANSNWGEGFLEILYFTAKKVIEKRSIHSQLSPQSDYSISGISEPSGNLEDLQFTNSSNVNYVSHKKISQFGLDIFSNGKNLRKSSSKANYNILINALPTRQNSAPAFSSNSGIGLNSSSSISLNNNQNLNYDINTVNDTDQTNNNENNNENDDGDNDTLVEEDLIDDDDAIKTVVFSMNEMGFNCFHIAAIKNCMQIFNSMETKYKHICEAIYLVPSGLTGFTVLHYLSMCGHYKLLNYILDNHKNVEKMIDIHSKDPIVSPLYIAAKFNQEKCIKVLKLHGADINNMTKRPRNSNQYIHYQFIQTLLSADTDLLQKINLGDEIQVSNKEQNPEEVNQDNIE